MASVALDVTSRRTFQQLAVPGSVEDFTVDLDLEWVRSLGGWTEDDLARGMTGSQSLVVNLRSERRELKHLDELLGELLARYRADEYKEYFGFIDALRPLPSADQQVPRLDAMLTRAVALRKRTIRDCRTRQLFRHRCFPDLILSEGIDGAIPQIWTSFGCVARSTGIPATR